MASERSLVARERQGFAVLVAPSSDSEEELLCLKKKDLLMIGCGGADIFAKVLQSSYTHTVPLLLPLVE